MKKISFCIVSIVVLILSLQSCYNNSTWIDGTVSKVYENEKGNIVINIEKDTKNYHILNPIDKGLMVDELKEKLLNKDAVVYIKKCEELSDLDYCVYKLKFDGKVIYSE